MIEHWLSDNPMTSKPVEIAAALAKSDEKAECLATRHLTIEKELRGRFRNAGDGNATNILFQAALEHLLERAR